MARCVPQAGLSKLRSQALQPATEARKQAKTDSHVLKYVVPQSNKDYSLFLMDTSRPSGFIPPVLNNLQASITKPAVAGSIVNISMPWNPAML